MTVPLALDHREVEWQFEAIDLRPVERWLTRPARPGSNVRVEPLGIVSLMDVYLDTEDWRVYRAGYVLRLRSQAGQQFEATLKSHDGERDGLRDRREITESLPDGTTEVILAASGPVGRRVRAVIGRRPLRVCATLRTERTRYALALDANRIAELTLDATSIPLDDNLDPVRLNRVEIETDAESVDHLTGFVSALREDCGLQPATLSKFDAAMIAHGLRPESAVDLGPEAIDQTMTIGEVAYAVLRRHFAAFLAHEPGTRLGDDPEELHDMRVAARRLRAALSLFADYLPLNAQRIREELGWVAQALGAVRDLDVQIAQLEDWRPELPPEEREQLEPLIVVLTERRATARDEMLAVLDSHRYDRLVLAFTSMLRRGTAMRPASGNVPVVNVAPDLLEQRYRRFRKHGDRITLTSPPEQYHELRIRGKRLRYALEFFADIYGKPVRAVVESLVAVQDVLGAHQDAIVAVEHLRELSATASDKLPGETIFLMGRLAERYAMQAAEARTAFPRAYDKLGGKTWKALRRRLEHGRHPLPSPPAEEQPEPTSLLPIQLDGHGAQ